MAPGTTRHPDLSGRGRGQSLEPSHKALGEVTLGLPKDSQVAVTGGGAEGDQVSLRGSPGAAGPAPSLPLPAPRRPRALGLPAAVGGAALPVCARLWPPARLGREVGARTEEAETAAAPGGPRSEARGCMARPALLGDLLVLQLWIAAVGQVATATGECGPLAGYSHQGVGGVGRTKLGRDLGGRRGARSSIALARMRAEVVAPSMPYAKSPAFAFRAGSP